MQAALGVVPAADRLLAWRRVLEDVAGHGGQPSHIRSPYGKRGKHVLTSASALTAADAGPSGDIFASRPVCSPVSARLAHVLGPFRRRRQTRVDAGLTDARFWELLQSSPSPGALHGQLAILGDGDLLAFERRHAELHAEAYDWGLWGAAYVLHGGCSDDTFADFRAYLLSLGREVYESARTDPDSLADVALDASGETWEDWASPSMHVIHARTGKWDLAGSPPTSPPHPTGEEWREDGDELARRFPRLTAAYGHP